MGRVNLVSGHVKTQLIAHDKEVYDIGVYNLTLNCDCLCYNFDESTDLINKSIYINTLLQL